MHKRQGPMWMEGVLSVDENAVHVEPSDGKRRQSYKLFDHVTVTIQLSNHSDVHARTLAFYLLSRFPISTGKTNISKHGNDIDDIKVSKMDFLQEIKKDQKKLDDDAAKDNASDELMETEALVKTEKISMYRFFQDMKTVGETGLKE